jgi:hypothetical protein
MLGGCTNYVKSSQPWFTAEDARQAPAVRSGWWVANDPDCKFTAEAPSAAWPECVKPVLLPPGDRLILRTVEPSRGDYLLVAGEPAIVQVLVPGDKTAEPPTADEYTYYGLRTMRRDPQGRITTFDVWPVLCGPPDRKAWQHTFDDRPRRPWPGLENDPDAVGCTARDAQALRSAARRSKRLGAVYGRDISPTFQWVRDWRPGDQTQEEWLAAFAEQSH